MGVAVTVNTELRTRYNTWTQKPPTEFPNEVHTPQNPPALWARVSILGGEEQRMDIGTGSGSRTFRKPGVLIIQLFSPLNQGNNAVLIAADQISDIFRNWCGATITCGATSVNDIGNDNNGYFAVNVTVPFHTDYLA